MGGDQRLVSLEERAAYRGVESGDRDAAPALQPCPSESARQT